MAHSHRDPTATERLAEIATRATRAKEPLRYRLTGSLFDATARQWVGDLQPGLIFTVTGVDEAIRLQRILQHFLCLIEQFPLARVEPIDDGSQIVSRVASDAFPDEASARTFANMLALSLAAISLNSVCRPFLSGKKP